MEIQQLRTFCTVARLLSLYRGFFTIISRVNYSTLKTISA